MKVYKRNLDFFIISFCYAFFCFIFSWYVYPYYEFGDQFQYRLFYENIGNYGFYDGFQYYHNQLGSLEPVYFLLVKFFSIFLSKDLFFSFLNFVLVFFVCFNLLRYRAPFYFILTIFLNFYFLVLLFAAERLKISFLFLIIGLTFSGLIRNLFFSFSFFSHIQSIFVLYIIFLKSNYINLKNINIKKNSPFRFVIFVIFVSLMIFSLKDQILNKFFYYLNNGGVVDMVKSSIFVILACLCAPKNNKYEPLFIGFPLILASFFIGADRMVIIIYMLFLIYGFKYNRGYNVFVFISTLYFCWKGYNFLVNIIHYGNGFYNPVLGG